MDHPLILDFQDADLRVWGLTHQLARTRRTLEQLQAESLLCNPTSVLEKTGYRGNYGIAADETLASLSSGVLSGLLARCARPRALWVHHSYPTSTTCHAGEGPADFISCVNYLPAALMRQMGIDHIPYFVSFGSGCAGFLSLVISGASMASRGGANPVVCLTADVKPPGVTYDSQREKILTSDCASGFLIGREQVGFKILGVSYYSTARQVVPLVEIVKRCVQLVRELASSLGVQLKPGEVVVHYPNIFPVAWDMVTQYLGLGKESHVVDGLADRAHCLSTDTTISLARNHRGADGRLHVVINFGSGLHLGACILREESTLEPGN